MNANEVYFVIKPMGKAKLLSFFRVLSDGKVVQDTTFLRVLGYYKESVTSFWGMLSSDQQYKALIVSLSTLREVDSVTMPKIMHYGSVGNIKLVSSLYETMWLDLKKVAILPAWFADFSDGKPIRY